MPFEPIPRWIPDEDGHTGALYNNFSVYVLRQQWPSEWCCREQTHGWCLDILSAPYRERMVLHGLWPEYDDLQANTTRTHGYWPQFCKRPSFDYKVCYSVGSTAGLPVECSIPKRDRKILHQDWTNYAPGYPFNTEDASRGWNLGDHEYAKHGTCTNLTSLVYLKEGIRLMKLVKTPPIVYLNVGHSVSISDLQHAYRRGDKDIAGKTKATAFACSDDGNLFGVSTCWSVDGSTGRPLVRIDCPENVLRNKYSNNCILNKDGMVYIRGAFPGQCKAPVGIPSGYHIFLISAGIFGALLVMVCFIRMLQELYFDNQTNEDGDNGRETYERLG